ncbi:MAG: pectinacetylesterase family protein [Gammaproteobacteria bacterium]|nr:pectinacetylesterase family protein [Gammaproteobacteria bacterium]
MYFRRFFATLLLVFFAAPILAHADRHQNSGPAQLGQWQKIIPDTEMHVVDGNGNERLITPSCSGALEVTGFGPSGPIITPSDKTYAFYYRPGSSEETLVYFDGGGACWNEETCASSLLPGLTGGKVPSSFLGKLVESSSPENLGGIFDFSRNDNPFKNHSIIFVPFCTGDIFWGSNTAIYKNTSLTLLQADGTPVTLPIGDMVIEHRGFDNFLAVREWMKTSLLNSLDESVKLTVAGSSAGAYGALLAFPYLKQLLPNSRAHLLSDGGNGVILDKFIQDVFQSDISPWQARANFPNWLPAFEAATFGDPDLFIVTINTAIAMQYPRDRFAQFTTAWDAVQILFYNIMKSEYTVPNNGFYGWFNVNAQTAGEWNLRMQAGAGATSAAANYRFHITPGCVHTALRFTDEFYSQTTGLTPLNDWIKNMISNRGNAWQSESCDGADCKPPVYIDETGNIRVDQDMVNACLVKSFGS